MFILNLYWTKEINFIDDPMLNNFCDPSRNKLSLSTNNPSSIKRFILKCVLISNKYRLNIAIQDKQFVTAFKIRTLSFLTILNNSYLLSFNEHLDVLIFILKCRFHSSFEAVPTQAKNIFFQIKGKFSSGFFVFIKIRFFTKEKCYVSFFNIF